MFNLTASLPPVIANLTGSSSQNTVARVNERILPRPPQSVHNQPFQTRWLGAASFAGTSQAPTSQIPLNGEARVPNPPVPKNENVIDQDTFNRYAERTQAELQHMRPCVRKATSSALNIGQAIEENRRTPFTDRITNARIRDTRKLNFLNSPGKAILKLM